MQVHFVVLAMEHHSKTPKKTITNYIPVNYHNISIQKRGMPGKATFVYRCIFLQLHVTVPGKEREALRKLHTNLEYFKLFIFG